MVNLFLEQFSREWPAGVHAVLIWDGAGYHTSQGLVVPPNVSLIQLPPYSPELNPVENLWHYLRSHDWSIAGVRRLRGVARRGGAEPVPGLPRRRADEDGLRGDYVALVHVFSRASYHLHHSSLPWKAVPDGVPISSERPSSFRRLGFRRFSRA